ncbi:MAG TPA: death-on-curing protein [Candidatus Kerfeldbacteria bacterium]|nr:death-on-curing protein [Candidatus Kerfeldbacteria bacterium]
MAQSVIYQAKTGAIQLRGDIKRETIWATQAQISKIFNIDRSVVTKHVKNILNSKELSKKSNVQKMHIAHSDKPVSFYSLDIILGVGYRANSSRAIEFRKWATKVLRQHIINGYTINRSRIGHNYEAFQAAVNSMQLLLSDTSTIHTKEALDLVKVFATTWLSLDAYDKEQLPESGTTKQSVVLTSVDLLQHISNLKRTLLKNNSATDIFAVERISGSIEGIIGNVMQSFGDKLIYPTVEEKAAHLLYFIVKNHPFIDGNKRCGAYAFIWFLQRANLLDRSNISPAALTVLTLFIAESSPKHKERMVRLILQLLKK